MKKILFLISVLLVQNVQSQQTLFSDDFESGTSNWTLNSNPIGENLWVINDKYQGLTLFGFPLFPNVPSQQSTGIIPADANYLHIANEMFCMMYPANCNAMFDTSSTSDNSAELNQNIDATNKSNVTITFWYLNIGDQSAYGTVEYTLDNGVNWVQMGTKLFNQPTWTQLSLTDPALDNQPSIRFRFRWRNASTGDDPAFSVDNIVITADNSNSSSILTNQVIPSNWCFVNTGEPGQNVTINFTANGVYNSGNIFTAQLSDLNGVFTNAISIGTLASSSNGTLSINAIIPPGTPVGSGYKIRIISSNPNVVGVVYESDIEIYDLPTISITANPASGNINHNQTITLTATGALNYTWTPVNIVDNPNLASVVVTPNIQYPTQTVTVTGTDANGCKNSTDFVVTINDLIINQIENNVFSVYPNPVNKFFSIKNYSQEEIKSVEIFDLNGKLIELYSKSNIYNIEGIISGIYTLKINTEKTIYFHKLIIE